MTHRMQSRVLGHEFHANLGERFGHFSLGRYLGVKSDAHAAGHGASSRECSALLGTGVCTSRQRWR